MKTKYWFLIGAILVSAYIGDVAGLRSFFCPQEIEDKILGERLTESPRSAIYLPVSLDKPSPPINPDTEEPKEETYVEETAGSLAIDQISDESSEEELQDESALNETDGAEGLSEANQPAERMRMTEVGGPIPELGGVDMAKIEERLVNEQLANSLRNPAYLQTGLVELPSEATSEEDGVD